jgi:hypothetical protein
VAWDSLAVPEAAEAFSAAKELLYYMIARTTGGPDVDGLAYTKARFKVLADPVASKLAPECVRVCRDPDAAWSYVKAQFAPLETYESRRQFFREQFEPLLSGLERFEAAPLDDLVAASTERLNSASVTAAWGKALARRKTDPEGAITAARTLLEATCKTILDDRGGDYGHRDDLPKLYGRVAKGTPAASPSKGRKRRRLHNAAAGSASMRS